LALTLLALSDDGLRGAAQSLGDAQDVPRAMPQAPADGSERKLALDAGANDGEADGAANWQPVDAEGTMSRMRDLVRRPGGQGPRQPQLLSQMPPIDGAPGAGVIADPLAEAMVARASRAKAIVDAAAGGSESASSEGKPSPNARPMRLRDEGAATPPRPLSQDQGTEPRTRSWDAFDGAGSTWTPADPAIAVGTDHVVGAANAAFNVYDKGGDALDPDGPFAFDEWFDDALSLFPVDFSISSPKLVYDPEGERYLMAARANNLDEKLSIIALSVSEVNDPTSWCSFAFAPALDGDDLKDLMVGDYSMGVNHDAIYFAAGMFEVVDAGTRINFDHTRVMFLAKDTYYQDACPSAEDWEWSTFSPVTDGAGDAVEGLYAVPNLDGSSDAFFVATNPAGGSAVNLFRAQTRSGASPFSGSLQRRAPVSVTRYDVPPDAEQRGTSELVSTGRASVTSAVQRDDRLWVAHPSSCTFQNEPQPRACPKWYELDASDGTVMADERWGQANGYGFVPAVMPDGSGEPVVVNNRAARSDFIGVRFSDGRENAYTLGAGRGTACYDDGRGNPSSVWGFTNGIALDPDRGTVWAHAAYAKGDSTSNCGDNDWQTVIFEIDWLNRSGGDGITGTVFFKGQPEPDAVLELREIDAQDAETTVATTSTDSDGDYVFADVPTLPSGHAYYVRYRNPSGGGTADNDRIGLWFSNSIHAYRAGESADGGSFDVADVELVEPPPGATVPFGTTFRWQLRGGSFRAQDDELAIRWMEESGDTIGFSAKTRASSLRVDRADLPARMSPGRRYRWSMRACQDVACDSFGYANWTHAVTFQDTAPTPTPGSPPPPAGPGIALPLSVKNDMPGVFVGGAIGYIDRQGSVSGRANTGIQIQNLDGRQPVDVSTTFFEQRDLYDPGSAGRPARTHPVVLPPISPGAAGNIYLPSKTLPDAAFSALVRGTLPIAAIVRTDWQFTNGAAIYSNPEAAADVIVPLAVKRYFGQTSIVTIQNTDPDAPATFTAEMSAVGESAPRTSKTATIPAGESMTLDFGSSDPAFVNLPATGFLGSMRVRASRPVAVQSYVNMENSQRAVSGFEGVPAARASSTLYVPLFRSRQRGIKPTDRLDTGISVVNFAPTPAQVTVVYFSTDNTAASEACRSRRQYVHGPISIPGNSSHVFFQGAFGGHDLPEDCFGSAVITTADASQRVVAIVNEVQNGNELAAAYNAVPREQVTGKVAVPLFRRNHFKLTTGIQVMNVGTRAAEVKISFVESGSDTPITNCAECLATVEPNRSYTWWPPRIDALPDGVFGSAVIESPEPITVIVNDFPMEGQVDAAVYNGIPIP